MTINTTYHGIESTPAIAAYVQEKFEGLNKYFDGVQHIDVEVGKSTHHHQKGEVFVCKAVVQTLKDVLRIEKEADDLYKAIDQVKDHLRSELADLKDRIHEQQHGGGG